MSERRTTSYRSSNSGRQRLGCKSTRCFKLLATVSRNDDFRKPFLATGNNSGPKVTLEALPSRFVAFSVTNNVTVRRYCLKIASADDIRTVSNVSTTSELLQNYLLYKYECWKYFLTHFCFLWWNQLGEKYLFFVQRRKYDSHIIFV